MAELVWPSDIVPSSSEWRIIDSTAVFNSALSGVTRTVSRPGLRMACTLNFAGLSGDHRSRVQAIISALRGRTNRIWLADDSSVRRGSFPASEVISNTTFPNTTGWAGGASEITIAADSGRLRLTRTTVVADRTIYATATTVASVPYLLRAGIIAGRGNIRAALRLGTTAGGTEIVNGAITTTGSLIHVVGTTTGTTTYPAIADWISGRSANDFQIVDSPSMARCALVNGGSQTGSSLWIDALPTSTNSLLYAGDLIAVYTSSGWEMKRLIADLNSNSSGQGQVVFEPPLRSSPADNAPVAFHRPIARFLLAEEETGWSSRPGVLSDFSLSFVEDLT